MRKSKKPGPKSRTAKSQVKPVGADLGESTVDEDDSNANLSDSADDFRSPERDDDATDYHLEYTSSGVPLAAAAARRPGCVGTEANVRRASPRRRTTAAPEANRTDTFQAPSATPAREKPTTAKTPNRRKQPQPRSTVRTQLLFMREVHALQQRTDFLIPRLPFSRLVRELIYSVRLGGVDRITLDALLALQTASEMYLTQRLQDAYMLTLHRGRVTLNLKDMELIKYLRSSNSGGQDQ